MGYPRLLYVLSTRGVLRVCKCSTLYSAVEPTYKFTINLKNIIKYYLLRDKFEKTTLFFQTIIADHLLIFMKIELFYCVSFCSTASTSADDIGELNKHYSARLYEHGPE